MFYSHYYQHPALIVLFSVVVLLISIKNHTLFRLVAVITPIVSGLCVYILPMENNFRLFSVDLSYIGSWHNKLIASGFLLALLSANLNAMGRSRYLEIILGNLYGSMTLFCLFAGDFFSLFVSLELMAIVSSVMIFIGGHKSSLRAAKKYFITHLTSGNMVIIGIVHLFSVTGSFSVINVTHLMNEMSYSTIMLSLMLIGMLINVASFPFSGWMVNYYPQASSSGFVYLILFTTKLSLVLLLKIFAGLYWLKYVAVIMILYSCCKVIIEKNILRALCYFSIIAMGFMLLGISDGSEHILDAVICYVFLHILYKLMLSLVCTNLPSEDINNLFAHNSIVMNVAICSGIIAMVGIPGTFVFVIKDLVSSLFHDNLIIYVSIISMTFFVSFAIPWKSFINQHNAVFNVKITLFTKASILLATTVTWCVMLFGSGMLDFVALDITSFASLKQVFIVFSAMLLSFVIKHKRVVTKSVNLIELIGDIIFYFHTMSDSNNEKTNDEPLLAESVEFQYKRFFQIFHNQQTSVFIVFTLLSLMLYLLIS
ncbi:MAG TPA: proton-conducting transporter membrane subunit [Candidatus Megaira endosymbiont of Nemacystus decipiens]|nr:proton-conducting transporter membrane subunit [Candidatus Megaera endosymbiont of Nemacystus decipiens]